VIEIKKLAALSVRSTPGSVVIPPRQQAVRHQQRDMLETAGNQGKSCGVVDQLPARRNGTRRARCALGSWLAYITAMSLPALALADTQAGSEPGAWTYDASIYLYVPTIVAFWVTRGPRSASVEFR
jgi:hypothetical protein